VCEAQPSPTANALLPACVVQYIMSMIYDHHYRRHALRRMGAGNRSYRFYGSSRFPQGGSPASG
jgi:hypothetical protein